MAELETHAISEIIRELPLKGEVGFDSLPCQLVQKRIVEGFTFNILCIGETGIGKSTLISTLFDTELDTSKTLNHNNCTVSLKSKKYNLNKNEVPLKLTVTETVGYGDQINKEAAFEPILNYIDSHFEKYLQEELKIKRNVSGYRDTRIHVCLYFICPTGHTIKACDLMLMNLLNQKVNLIPLIAKADTLTKTELQTFKSSIRRELQKETIEIYCFPASDEVAAESESTAAEDIPFAIVGSADIVESEGKLIRGRSYPWGTVCIEDENHSDVSRLRKMLIQLHLEDLKERTHTKHYENYRLERLKQLGYDDFQAGEGCMSLIDTLNAKAEDMRREFRFREEEVVHSFIEKVKRTEQELVDEEISIKDKYSYLEKQAEEQKMALDKEEKLLLKDIDAFRKKVRDYELKRTIHREKKQYS